MTTLTTNTASRPGFASGLFSVLRDAFRRRAVYARVRNELSSLNDRELEDIGLHRALIEEVAAEAAAAV